MIINRLPNNWSSVILCISSAFCFSLCYYFIVNLLHRIGKPPMVSRWDSEMVQSMKNDIMNICITIRVWRQASPGRLCLGFYTSAAKKRFWCFVWSGVPAYTYHSYALRADESRTLNLHNKNVKEGLVGLVVSNRTCWLVSPNTSPCS